MAERDSFSEMLSDLDDSRFEIQLSEMWAECNAKLRQHAAANHVVAKGEVTITLKLSVTEHGEVDINHTAKSKLPATPVGRSHRWADEDGKLWKTPPQQKLPLHEVPSGRQVEVPGTGRRLQAVPGGGNGNGDKN